MPDRYPTDAELATALVDLGGRLAFPEPGERFVASVMTGVEPLGRPVPAGGRVTTLRPRRAGAQRRPVWSLVAAAVVVLVLTAAAVLVASPAARHAVADLLGLGGVRVEQTSGPLPSPRFEGFHLGRQVTLDEARARSSFPILVPAGMTPDEVYVDEGLHPGEVSMVFRAGPGLPAAHPTGAGMLISEFRAEPDEDYLRKLTHVGTTTVTGVTVNGRPGLWISGAPHAVYYVDPEGRSLTDTVRLAGDVLLWESNGITYRIESALPLERVLEIASSMQ
jgi:hypothetical protein